tara:strand:+ start:87 stop:1283 length:1197 start_codon:yes stop_codon:yes gene_type:complete
MPWCINTYNDEDEDYLDMAVFQALRNIAQSGLAGLITGATSSLLGLNRAQGLRFPDSESGRPTGGDTKKLYQYPLDLGSTGNSHFIAFFVRERTFSKISIGNSSPGELDIGTVAQNAGQSFLDDIGTETPDNFSNNEGQQLTAQIKTFGKRASGRSHDGKSLTQKLAPTVRTKQSVALYFPPTVSQSYEIKYAETEMGTGTVLGADVIMGFVEQGASTDSFKNAKNAMLEALKVESLSMLLKSAEILPGLSGIGAAVGIARGKVKVPKMEVTFEGVGKRNFSYSFMFTPSSEQEADEINSIIKLFRVNAAPDYTDGLGIEMNIPNTFDIAYYTGARENGYLHKIGECYLKNVNVTYGGDKMAFHKPNETGAPPTRTTMQLDFAELQTVTKSLIQDQGF